MGDSGESEALQLRVSLSPCSPIAVRLEIAFGDEPPDLSDASTGLSSDGDQYVLHHLLGGEQALIAGEILRWETGGAAVPSAAFERLHQVKFEIGVGHYEQMHAQQIDVLAARLSEMAVELGLPVPPVTPARIHELIDHLIFMRAGPSDKSSKPGSIGIATPTRDEPSVATATSSVDTSAMWNASANAIIRAARRRLARNLVLTALTTSPAVAYIAYQGFAACSELLISSEDPAPLVQALSVREAAGSVSNLRSLLAFGRLHLSWGLDELQAMSETLQAVRMGTTVCDTAFVISIAINSNEFTQTVRAAFVAWCSVEAGASVHILQEQTGTHILTVGIAFPAGVSADECTLREARLRAAVQSDEMARLLGGPATIVGGLEAVTASHKRRVAAPSNASEVGHGASEGADEPSHEQLLALWRACPPQLRSALGAAPPPLRANGVPESYVHLEHGVHARLAPEAAANLDRLAPGQWCLMVASTANEAARHYMTAVANELGRTYMDVAAELVGNSGGRSWAVGHAIGTEGSLAFSFPLYKEGTRYTVVAQRPYGSFGDNIDVYDLRRWVGQQVHLAQQINSGTITNLTSRTDVKLANLLLSSLAPQSSGQNRRPQTYLYKEQPTTIAQAMLRGDPTLACKYRTTLFDPLWAQPPPPVPLHPGASGSGFVQVRLIKDKRKVVGLYTAFELSDGLAMQSPGTWYLAAPGDDFPHGSQVCCYNLLSHASSSTFKFHSLAPTHEPNARGERGVMHLLQMSRHLRLVSLAGNGAEEGGMVTEGLPPPPPNDGKHARSYSTQYIPSAQGLPPFPPGYGQPRGPRSSSGGATSGGAMSG